MAKNFQADKKTLIFYFLISLILIDFGNQLRILSYLPAFKTINNAVFSIEHVFNTGGAFGLLQNSTIFLSVFAIFVSIFLFVYILKYVNFSQKTLLLSLTLLNAGAIGNLIERIQFHHVVDYIKLNFINFPVFNAFDIMICLGITIYVIFDLVDIEEIKNFLNNADKNRRKRNQ